MEKSLKPIPKPEPKILTIKKCVTTKTLMVYIGDK